MTDEPLILDIQTGPEPTDTARCVVVISAVDRHIDGEPLSDDFLASLDTGDLRTRRAALIPSVPLVKIPKRPKQTRADWRRQMKGER